MDKVTTTCGKIQILPLKNDYLKIENYWKILSIGIGFSDRNNYGNYKHVLAFQAIVYVYIWGNVYGDENIGIVTDCPLCMRVQSHQLCMEFC